MFPKKWQHSFCFFFVIFALCFVILPNYVDIFYRVFSIGSRYQHPAVWSIQVTGSPTWHVSVYMTIVVVYNWGKDLGDLKRKRNRYTTSSAYIRHIPIHVGICQIQQGIQPHRVTGRRQYLISLWTYSVEGMWKAGRSSEDNTNWKNSVYFKPLTRKNLIVCCINHDGGSLKGILII